MKYTLTMLAFSGFCAVMTAHAIAVYHVRDNLGAALDIFGGR